MKTDMVIFLRTPEHEEHYPGKVSATTDKGYSAVFKGGVFSLESGAEVVVFYDIKGRFMQQPVRVLSVREEKKDGDGTRLALGLETIGDPVSANTRESYRVSCYSEDIKARLGKDPEMCEVLDLSATGFAILSNAEYRVGQRLQATLYHNGTAVQGTAVLHSHRLIGKKNRYGLRAVDDQRRKATLMKDLNRINLAVQRAQAARLSGKR